MLSDLKTRHMAVIVTQIIGVGLWAIIRQARRCRVLIVVMVEVMRGLTRLVATIIRHRSPGNLEREQAQHEKHEKASHGRHHSSLGRALSMSMWIEYRGSRRGGTENRVKRFDCSRCGLKHKLQILEAYFCSILVSSSAISVRSWILNKNSSSHEFGKRLTAN